VTDNKISKEIRNFLKSGPSRNGEKLNLPEQYAIVCFVMLAICLGLRIVGGVLDLIFV